MRKPLVSVIIPAYNAEKHIERSLGSCIKQTYKNIQIVLINDGSTDRTEEIIKEYKAQDDRILLISTENQGVSSARNTGIENAKGEFLTFLDADDALIEDAIEKSIELIIEHNADVVCGQTVAPPDQEENIYILQGKEPVLAALEDKPISYSACGKLYKTGSLKGIRFSKEYRIHEDSFFLFEYFLTRPKIVVTNQKVYEIVLTSGSASRADFSEKFLDILRVADKKIEIIKKNHPELYEKTYNLAIKANMAILRKLRQTKDGKYKNLEKQCIKEVVKKKKYFLAATPEDEKIFKIITRGLYGIYKPYYQLKCLLKEMVLKWKK